MAVPSTPSVSVETADDEIQTSLLNRISWGAIIAGVVVALVTQLILNMLGIGIGASALEIGQGANNSGSGFSIGAGLWWTFSGIVAAFLGALVAGRLAGAARGDTASWHGIVVWATTTLLVIYLLTSAVGGILGGAFNVVGSVVGGAGKAAASAAGGLAKVAETDTVSSQARQLVDPNSVQSVQDDVTTYVRASLQGDREAAAEAKQRAVQGISQTTHVTPAEAQAKLDLAEAKAHQTLEVAKQKATKAADEARRGVSFATLLGALALALGALASWFGGARGARAHERAGILVDARRGVSRS